MDFEKCMLDFLLQQDKLLDSNKVIYDLEISPETTVHKRNHDVHRSNESRIVDDDGSTAGWIPGNEQKIILVNKTSSTDG